MPPIKLLSSIVEWGASHCSRAYTLVGSGLTPLAETMYFSGIYANTLSRDNKTQILNGRFPKIRFMTFHPQFVSVQYVWHNVAMEKMILPSLAKDQCISQIDHHNFAQICFENIIDYPLESGKSVSKTKWHEHPFIKPKFGFENCLPCLLHSCELDDILL